MENSTKIALLRGLFQIAWADGIMQTEELNFLKSVIARVDVGDIDPDFDAWFTAPPVGPDPWAALASESTAEIAVHQLASLAAADGTFKWEELQLLDNAIKKLGVDKARFNQILREVEKAYAQGAT